MAELSSIDQFLARALRAVRSGEAVEWAEPETCEWEQVWSRIEYHGIVLLLHQSAKKLLGWPAPLLNRMAEEARLIVLWESTHQSALSDVLQALQSSGVEAILMKGTALAYAFHAEPAMRRRGDTDLLVHPKDQASTRAILAELGWYRKEDPHGLYFQEGWLHDAAGFFVHSIDLHWEPTDRPVLHQVLPIEEFFERKRPIPDMGKGAFRPELDLMIVHATINQKYHAQHGYGAEGGNLTSPRRLIWSVDFDLMVSATSDEDWRLLAEHCNQVGIGSLVAEALLGVQADLGTKLPVGILEQLGAQTLNSDMEAYFSSPDGMSQFWLDLRHTSGLGKKFNLVMTRAFPPRSHLVEKYPSAQEWPTALLQGRMLLNTAARLIRKVASR